MKRGRVHHDVQSAEFFYRSGNSCSHRLRLGDIAPLYIQTHPACLGFESQLLIRRDFDPARENLGPARSKALGDSTSDPSGPGNNCDFPVKFTHAGFSILGLASGDWLLAASFWLSDILTTSRRGV